MTERGTRAIRRSLIQAIDCYSTGHRQEVFEAAYQVFQQYLSDEDQMISEDEDLETFVKCLRQCPHIDTVVVILSNQERPRTDSLRQAFKDAMLALYSDAYHHYGVRQLTTALQVAHRAEFSLKALYAGEI